MEEPTQKQTPVEPNAEPPKHTEPVEPTVTTGKSKNTKLWIWIVVIIVVAAAAIGAGIWWYMSNTPDSLLRSAVENFSKEKSYSVDYDFTTGSGQNATSYKGSFAIAADPANANNGEAIFKINLNGNDVGVNVLTLGSNIYLKPTGMDNLVNYITQVSGADNSANVIATYDSILSSVDDQWLSMASDEVQSLTQATTGTGSLNGAPKQSEIAKIAEIYTQHPFVVVDRTYGDEVIDGSSCAHFSIKADAGKYADFLQAVKTANLPDFAVTDNMVSTARSGKDPVTNFPVEVWITKDSKKFKQLKITDNSSSNPNYITLTFKSTLPTFDAFQAPSSSKTLNDLMLQIMDANGNLAQ